MSASVTVAVSCTGLPGTRLVAVAAMVAEGACVPQLVVVTPTKLGDEVFPVPSLTVTLNW